MYSSLTARVISAGGIAWRLREVAARAVTRSLATFHSPIVDVHIPNTLTYPEFVLQRCSELGDKPSLVSAETGKTFTFSQLAEGSRNVASGLAKLGMKHKDVMCIYSNNCIEYPLAMYGIMLAGGVLTTANPEYTVAELAGQLKDCQSKFLLTTKEKFAVAAEAAKASGAVQEIFVIDERVEGAVFFGDMIEDDGKSNPEGSFPFNQDEDLAAILYSSGTTGLPKGVMLSHRNLVGNILQCLACMDELPNQRMLGVLPFFHVYGQVPVLAFAFRYGYQLSVMKKFDPVLYLETLQNHKLTWIHIVPPIVLFMLMHPMVEKYDLSSLVGVMSAAAPLSADTEEAFRKKFPHIDIMQGWGMTEISPVGAIAPMPHSRWRKTKIGSGGMLVPNMEMRVVDPQTKKVLDHDQIGEFQVRGVNVMKGYYRNEAATADSFTSDGWFRTGDVGLVDQDSYMFISDRLKELIKVKGLQVAPAELEGLLLDCPGVSDVGVIGKADERAGELPFAFVVLKPDSQATEASIRDWLAERVSPHKRLEGGVRFINSIPKAASGKILRKELRALLAAES